MRSLGRSLRAFGRFGFDFLFGDSLLLFPATLVIVAAAFGLRHHRVTAYVVVPLLVVVVISAAVFIGRQGSSDSTAARDTESD